VREPRIIDANIVLRFLTNDLPEQADRCTKLLKRVEDGMEEVILPELVLADIVWILEKFYCQPKEKIRDLLIALLNLRGLRHPNKKTAKEALRLYAEKNIDWTDAFVASQMFMQKRYEIYSYDTDFERIEGITRLEP